MLKDTRSMSCGELQTFLQASDALTFTGHSRQETYAWIEQTLRRYDYLSRPRRQKGLLRRYLLKISGFSPAQLTRLIAQYRRTGAVRSFDATNGYANGLEHFFIRGYVNFKTPEPGGTQDNIQRKLYYVADSPSSSDWSFFLTSDSAAGQLPLRFATNGNSYVPAFSLWDLAILSYDHWYCVELEVLLNTPGLSDGELSLWIDGEQTFQESGVNIRGSYTTGASTFLVGMQANRTLTCRSMNTATGMM